MNLELNLFLTLNIHLYTSHLVVYCTLRTPTASHIANIGIATDWRCHVVRSSDLTLTLMDQTVCERLKSVSFLCMLHWDHMTHTMTHTMTHHDTYHDTYHHIQRGWELGHESKTIAGPYNVMLINMVLTSSWSLIQKIAKI